jgi:hypothetical protein
MRSTPVAGAFFRQSTRRQNATSTISHRGFHDTKNGGFSTIGAGQHSRYYSRFNAPPESGFFRSRKIFPNFASRISEKKHKGNKHMKTIINNIYPAVAAFALCCFAVLPKAQAVSPAPDGCYPNFTTAEGCDALQSLTTGAGNTGVGWRSLFLDTTGSFNTGVGAGTLILNTGDSNTAVGAVALLLNTIGSNNTAVGTSALLNNTDGNDNTAIGQNALQANTTGYFNTATGVLALTANTIGHQNTAFGRAALFTNTEGFENTAVGIYCLQFNTTGSNNVAIGNSALQANTTGNGNVATGQGALLNNTTADNNTAYGTFALSANTTGTGNTATGSGALFDNTIGNFNTANGNGALGSNTEGTNNTAIGQGALLANTDGGFNTAFGSEALTNLTSGSGNVGIGPGAGSALTSGGGNIYVGNPGVTTETATIRIGVPEHAATYIGGISGTPVVGDTVVVDANGQLGTATSSARFKKAIKPMDKTSDAILALKPVSFQYKSDSKGTPQFGLIAEEVAKVNPDLVVRDREGEIYSVRYEAVNAMLLNEFLKAHHQLQDLKGIVAEQQEQIKALTSGLQKVSAQMELGKPAPQMASLPAVALPEGGNKQ